MYTFFFATAKLVHFADVHKEKGWKKYAHNLLKISYGCGKKHGWCKIPIYDAIKSIKNVRRFVDVVPNFFAVLARNLGTLETARKVFSEI